MGMERCCSKVSRYSCMTLYKAVSSGCQLAQWQSKYASVTFNQYGVELPTGGINEKGLVVEIMGLKSEAFRFAVNVVMYAGCKTPQPILVVQSQGSRRST